MSSSANNQRVLVLSLFSVLSVSLPACVATDSSMSTSSSVELTDVAAADAAAQSIADPLGASAGPMVDAMASTRTMLNRSSDGVGIEISEGSGVNVVSIDTAADTSRAEILRLSNPSRVVIDLPPGAVSANRQIPVSDVEFISGIRLGAHKDHSRIVIDLPDSGEITHSESVTPGKISVTLASNTPATGPMAQPRLAASTGVGAIEPTTESLARVNETTLATTSDSPAAPAAPALDSALAMDDDIVAKPLMESGGTTSLTGLRIETAGMNRAEIVADVQGAPEYTLIKTAPSEYVLTLKGAELSLADGQTSIIAPTTETGIRTVRAVTSGTDVALRIFAQPGTVLDVVKDGNAIRVQETDELALPDTRAQLDPDAGKKDEKPAEGGGKVIDDGSGSKVTISEKDAGTLSDSELGSLLEGDDRYTGRLISLDLQDTDIDNALRIIAEVSNLNIVASEDVSGKVTLRLIDVPWDQALDVILKTNGLDKVLEGNVMRIAPVDKLRQERQALKEARVAEEELEPLNVKYLRVSYAKAAELRTLVESVMSERGTAAYDERSNQLIIKDTKKGLKNVVELVSKIDLRTPQVLLETQIVEATRTIIRELGAQLGFNYTASPATGNATGWNFPNSISVGGAGTGGQFANFPASSLNSALGMVFSSADGTKSLDLFLSQFETEGRVRVISRPAVATTNNKAATIKSVERVRIRLPQGGLAVGVGQGSAVNGAAQQATEIVEIGITLDVTPQASPDYYVLLDIRAKSSTFGSNQVDGIPSEVERSATSTVLVSSGQTFALGGIYKIRDEDRIEGVPFLKDIPFFGHFFRRSVTNNSDEELLFFITPRIVEGSFDDAAMKETV
jgi:type IV pilus assembly protein PilQ